MVFSLKIGNVFIMMEVIELIFLPNVIFEEIYKHKRKPFVLKDALDGLPHLVAKKKKGSKGIECAESGFTECDFYIYS